MKPPSFRTDRQAPRPDNPYRTAAAALLVVFCSYAALTATHGDEFWPFSIYQMFSSAVRPWTRALAREVPVSSLDDLWQPVSLTDLPGRPVALKKLGAPQNDFSAFVRQSPRWTPSQRKKLQALLGYRSSDGYALVIYRVDGTPGPRGAMVVCTPVLLVHSESVSVNPSLDAPCPTDRQAPAASLSTKDAGV